LVASESTAGRTQKGETVSAWDAPPIATVDAPAISQQASRK
jgi:hypothetical protein